MLGRSHLPFYLAATSAAVRTAVQDFCSDGFVQRAPPRPVEHRSGETVVGKRVATGMSTGFQTRGTWSGSMGSESESESEAAG